MKDLSLTSVITTNVANKLVYITLAVALLIACIAVFVPLHPAMPSAGLGPSWQLAMNHAIADGLSFGKDIIFTFGPYASVYTHLYHPSTDLITVYVSLYLAVSYWACLVLLMQGIKWRWTLLLLAFLPTVSYSRDALIFSYPLLAALLIFRLLLLRKNRSPTSKFAPFPVAMIFFPFGLLPLIKGSFLLACGAIIVLCGAFLFIYKKTTLAITVLLSPTIALIFFWTLSGQEIAQPSSYFINLASIISGYTDAMAIDGPVHEIILYLLVVMVFLVAIFFQRFVSIKSKVFLSSVYLVFLFLSFKAAFVRHDAHALAASSSLLIAFLVFPFVNNRVHARWVFSVGFCVVVVWVVINANYLRSCTTDCLQCCAQSVAQHTKAVYSGAWYGLRKRANNSTRLHSEFDVAMRSVKKQASFPSLHGKTDIYSYHQAYLIASGNTWSPRPIFQSYSVYTPSLAEINKNHLLGRSAPDNIVFRIEPIDGRLPSLEDGASWPILLANYKPNLMRNGFLFFEKKEAVGTIDTNEKAVREVHSLGERVVVPSSKSFLFAKVDIAPSIVGRIASILFKPSQLELSVELNDGTTRQYRFIEGMARSAFMISPLIENTTEFGMLYSKKRLLDKKMVRSINIYPFKENLKHWRKRYEITFDRINVNASVDILKLYKFEVFNQAPSDSVTTAAQCIGAIDTVNGMFPGAGVLSASNLLELRGWLAMSLDRPILPDAVYVTLTNISRHRKYIRARKRPRPDVGAHFKNEELNEAGYEALVDIAEFEGPYTLGLAYGYSGSIYLCPEFRIQVIIDRL